MATTTAKMQAMQPEIGIAEQDRKAVVKILNTVLSDEFLLYTKTRNYHWNVVGPQFQPLHAFFETQYDELAEIIDEVAERARSVGGRALGAMADFIENSRLKEASGPNPDARKMISSLLADHEAIVRHLRVDLKKCDEEHHDMGTSDFLTGLMERHEKMAWMLRAHLEGSSA